MKETKILLDENDIPRKWYNILPDMPTPLSPPLNPATNEPVGQQDLAAIFPMELIKQEMSQDRFISIPDEIRDIYRSWRPSPLYRAHKLEAAVTFARSEGIVPAPESSHAIKCAIEKALECKKTGEEKTILFNLSGHGHFDMGSYDSYFSGDMKDLS